MTDLAPGIYVRPGPSSDDEPREFLPIRPCPTCLAQTPHRIDVPMALFISDVLSLGFRAALAHEAKTTCVVCGHRDRGHRLHGGS